MGGHRSSKEARESYLPVSAIIPVAGRTELLVEAVRSILQGTALPAELIIVLSGTPAQKKRSRLAIAACPDFADRVRVLACDGPGPAAARNQGVTASGQPWTAFLDSDDLWTPQHLEQQWRYLSRRPHLKACHTRELWIRHGRELAVPRHLQPRTGRFLRDSMRTCLISASSLLIQRQFFLELGGFDESFLVCEDFELWLRLLSRSPLGLVPEALTVKRAGDWKQLSSSRHSLDRERIRAILKLYPVERWSESERQQARLAVAEKLEILVRGARKHGSLAGLTEIASMARDILGPTVLPEELRRPA
ncbi:MAG: glycosyltransferase family 2 protein [Spirochaetales bacterium]|nr:glycosyltransferase family 2 protein [Leptospiraceae bacterium]MCP5483338.1 glycosyltransferase family 2 protein [Spirochaetales bacterium]MCP5484127.1 glycosyltransferase family 2 protein [Spirochaetales bacterium]